MQNRFNIGDFVLVKGYGDKLFQVHAVNYEQAEIEKNSFYWYVCYHIYDAFDFIEATESDLTLVKSSFKKQPEPIIKKEKKKSKPKKQTNKKEETVDDILDEYIDTCSLAELYEEVGHTEMAKEYRDHAKFIVKYLKDRYKK